MNGQGTSCPLQCSCGETGFTFIFESDAGDEPRWRTPSPSCRSRRCQREGSEGSGSWGSGRVPDRKQPGALGVSELFKNKRNPLPALRRDKFSFQKLLFGMFNVFHQNHKALLFSSHFCDVFNG